MNAKNVSTGTDSYVEWSAILAGATLALAISFIFLQFGGMIGFEVFEPQQSGEKTRFMVIAVALWLFWVQLMSSMAGGYIAGRMRAPMGGSAHESEVRDGAHGLLVWASATLIAVAAAAIGSALATLGAPPTPAVKHHAEIAEDLTRNAGIIFGFMAAAGSLVSAVAAAWMGTIGGDHRDQGTRFNPFNRK